MKKRITFLFSGQGSQYYQMGRDLYKSMPVFQHYMRKLNHIFIEQTGLSLLKEMYSEQSTNKKFDNVIYTHPGLFVIQYALATTLMEDGIVPSRVIGASLGESVSLSVSGVIAPEDMLTALIKQAALLEYECSRGGMIAILADPAFFYDNPLLFDNCELAGINMQKLFCVSGSDYALSELESHLRKLNVTFERLPVNQPFHSSLLDPLHESFLETFHGIQFNKRNIEIVSSMSGKNNAFYNSAYLWDAIRSPISFYETIRNLKPDPEMIYIDLGSSGTLANFVKYIAPKNSYSKIYSIMNPFGNNIDNYMKLKNDFHAAPILSEVC